MRSMLVLLALAALGAPLAEAKSPAPGQAHSSSGQAESAPGQAQSTPSASAQTGGREYGEDDPVDTPAVAGAVAVVTDGIAAAPADAPQAVKELIWAGNEIVGSPYRLGGGHVLGFEDSAYDCSGTVSYALHGADLLKRPRDSSSFMRFGGKGAGDWITIYTRSSHAYLTVAGIRLDTSAADDPGGLKGPRWRPLRASDAGYVVRHPAGL